MHHRERKAPTWASPQRPQARSRVGDAALQGEGGRRLSGPPPPAQCFKGPLGSWAPPRQAGVAIQGCRRPAASVPRRMTGDTRSCCGGLRPACPPRRRSPSLSWRPAGRQQSRLAEPGQIRPRTKLSCCTASQRPLTAGRRCRQQLNAPLHSGCKRTWAQGGPGR